MREDDDGGVSLKVVDAAEEEPVGWEGVGDNKPLLMLEKSSSSISILSSVALLLSVTFCTSGTATTVDELVAVLSDTERVDDD